MSVKNGIVWRSEKDNLQRIAIAGSYMLVAIDPRKTSTDIYKGVDKGGKDSK